MASLLNTRWKIWAPNGKAITVYASFNAGGVLTVTFPTLNVNPVSGTWSEEGSNFKCEYVFNSEGPAQLNSYVGSHEGSTGSGTANSETLPSGPTFSNAFQMELL